MRKIFVTGAASAIAQETLRIYAREGDRFYLIGRDGEKLTRIAEDLIVRGANHVEVRTADVNDFELHQDIFESAIEKMSGIDMVFIAHGSLGNQKESETSYSNADREIRTNFLSVVSLLTYAANYLESKKFGCIVAISSVAGDRGRGSNYIYGSAKGALSLYLQGLRCRLYKSGIKVITIKPGFVDTPMTESIPKNFLFSSPEFVAKGIYRAVNKGRDVVYIPSFWFAIMFIVKLIPENIFKRMKL